MRLILNFKTDFKETPEYDHPKGYSISRFLYEELLKAEFKVQPPDNYDDFAWSIDCEINENKIFFFVGYLGTNKIDWQLIICSNNSLINKILRRDDHESLKIFSNKIHSILSNDVRFSELKWFEKYTGKPSDKWYPEP